VGRRVGRELPGHSYGCVSRGVSWNRCSEAVAGAQPRPRHASRKPGPKRPARCASLARDRCCEPRIDSRRCHDMVDGGTPFTRYAREAWSPSVDPTPRQSARRCRFVTSLTDPYADPNRGAGTCLLVRVCAGFPYSKPCFHSRPGRDRSPSAPFTYRSGEGPDGSITLEVTPVARQAVVRLPCLQPPPDRIPRTDRQQQAAYAPELVLNSCGSPDRDLSCRREMPAICI
jgi:hypothetical protein